MDQPRPRLAVIQNEILREIPEHEYMALRPLLTPYLLKPKRVLQLSKLSLEHVYFIQTGVVSILACQQEDTGGVEVRLVGHEGVVGLSAVLGADMSPHTAVVLTRGLALRMRSAVLPELQRNFPFFRAALLRHVNCALVQTTQVSACNAKHGVTKRMARWLLMVQDRLSDGVIPVTHETIARALGVRRASVTEKVSELALAGALASERGHIRICDRDALERAACSCYGTVKSEYDRLLRTFARDRHVAQVSHGRGVRMGFQLGAADLTQALTGPGACVSDRARWL